MTIHRLYLHSLHLQTRLTFGRRHDAAIEGKFFVELRDLRLQVVQLTSHTPVCLPVHSVSRTHQRERPSQFLIFRLQRQDLLGKRLARLASLQHVEAAGTATPLEDTPDRKHSQTDRCQQGDPHLRWRTSLDDQGCLHLVSGVQLTCRESSVCRLAASSRSGARRWAVGKGELPEFLERIAL